MNLLKSISSADAEEKKEKKVEYLELIYDLIFVYMIGRNSSLLHHIENGFVEPSTFLAYLLCSLAVIQVWMFTTYYVNLYGRNSVRDHVFMFVNMFLLYFMAEGTGVHWQKYHMQYHAAWALILTNIGVQYLIELRHHKNQPHHTRRITHMACILLIEALIAALAIPLYAFTGSTVLAPVAICFGIAAVSFSSRGACSAMVDFAHLSERAMLYVVFTFGEMIIAIAGYFEGSFNASSLYFSAMAFLIVTGLFLSYEMLYDHLIDRNRQTNGVGYMLLHVFLIFALNNITTALEFMRNSDILLLHKMIFLVLSLVLYYVLLFMTAPYAKKRCGFSWRFLLGMAAVGASFIGIMLLLRNHMNWNIAVTVLYVFGVFGVLWWNKRDSVSEE